ncbi:adenylate/guanylate cyclase domain-containing protein [Hyalangium rubrum]|uniref:Adenylate/guanylate cyclase domain-containing protein n=1 Tax=Hyalangium rubrum TaxID=3103134 RepID=A0ABU5H454_9BACT|nr:adenylate/guanylate cyclase domain-containing protein [Hyalangium sp. s54d21]MDY7228135.1 adenylate/guanylate cyclase domain-containing protein [Hyalangium sp. s54d21]
MKTANLAIVFTDIKGFTERTSRQTHEENQRLLQVHHDLLAPLFKAFGGRILKSIGDAFLVTFESPTQAVLSGVAIQDRLWQYNRSATENERLDVRVAINVGEVRVEASDVFGEPVNIASRVEGLAEAGEVYFTEAVYLAMNKAEVPSQEVGAFELKGIPGKIRVFRVPKGPYRMEAPVVPLPSPAGVPQEGPPFGNMALSRVMDAGAMGAELSGPAVLGQRAGALGSQARSLGGRALAGASRLLHGLPERLPPGVRSRLPAGTTGPRLALGMGALAVLLGMAVVALGGSSTDRAIAQVRKASPSERKSRGDDALKLIMEEKEPARRNYLLGQLHEAFGNLNNAMESYAAAAKAGSGKAEDRLTELLEHPDCRVRSDAASTIGELRLKSARGELEDLAEDGGPGDDGGSGLLSGFKCDSKRAAKNALKRLGGN